MAVTNGKYGSLRHGAVGTGGGGGGGGTAVPRRGGGGGGGTGTGTFQAPAAPAYGGGTGLFGFGGAGGTAAPAREPVEPVGFPDVDQPGTGDWVRHGRRWRHSAAHGNVFGGKGGGGGKGEGAACLR